MNTKVKRTIVELARANPTQEICGLIVRNETSIWVQPCENITREEEGKEGTFEIDPQQYITSSARGKVCGIYHSHPKGPAAFSEEDLKVAREIELPSHVYSVEVGDWATYIPEGYEVPLTGVHWIWGEADCFSTVQIYYRQKLGIYLGDYDRDETFKDADPEAIVRHIEVEGFRNLGADASLVLPHDVLLFATPGHRFPHHLGVYTELNHLLHHPYGVCSREEDLDGCILARLTGVLRYVKGPLKVR
jgi:proteasome lid subunit RPN8/RPN11